MRRPTSSPPSHATTPSRMAIAVASGWAGLCTRPLTSRVTGAALTGTIGHRPKLRATVPKAITVTGATMRSAAALASVGSLGSRRGFDVADIDHLAVDVVAVAASVKRGIGRRIGLWTNGARVTESLSLQLAHRHGGQAGCEDQQYGQADQRTIAGRGALFGQARAQPPDLAEEARTRERGDDAPAEQEGAQQRQQGPAPADRRYQREDHREFDDGVDQAQARHHVRTNVCGPRPSSRGVLQRDCS